MGLPKLQATQVPNIVFDYWLAILTPAEFKVLLFICRKTYGWHKERDMISLKQIIKATNLSRQGIINCVKALEENHQLIECIKTTSEFGDSDVNEYRIIFDDDVNSVDRGGELSRPRVVKSVDHGVVKSVDPQKKLYTKETITKERERASTSIQKKINRVKNINTTNQEHINLEEKHGKEVRDKCYQILSDWKEDTPRNKWKKCDYRSIDRWVIDAYKEKKKKTEKLSCFEDRKELGSKISKEFNLIAKKKNIRIDALDKGVQFVFLSSQKSPFSIAYNDPGFKQQLDNSMRKLGLI